MLREITEEGNAYEVDKLERLEEFNHSWNLLTKEQQADIESEVNRRLDKLVDSPNPNWGSITNTSIEGGKVSPETGIRGDWSGTPFGPIYDIFGDETLAGMFFGKVWKKVIIDRDEMWVGIRFDPTFPNRGITLMGKTYFLDQAQAA